MYHISTKQNTNEVEKTKELFIELQIRTWLIFFVFFIFSRPIIIFMSILNWRKLMLIFTMTKHSFLFRWALGGFFFFFVFVRVCRHFNRWHSFKCVWRSHSSHDSKSRHFHLFFFALRCENTANVNKYDPNECLAHLFRIAT